MSISPCDTVVLSLRCIPGNEEGIRDSLKGIHRRGAKIFLHEGEAKKLQLPLEVKECFLHVSGHGQREDILKTIEILKPEMIIPFHAPEDRVDLFEDFIAGRRNIKRLQAGETLKI